MASVAVGYLYGFVLYVGVMGGLKNAVSTGRRPMTIFLGVAALLLCGIFLFRRYIRDRAIRIVYQETGNAPLSIAADSGYWTPRRFDG
jgi:biotin transporter BioY